MTKSIEKFGSGFKRINSLCKDAGIKYSYERSNNGFKFVLYRPSIISDISNVTTKHGQISIILRSEAKAKPGSAGSLAVVKRTTSRRGCIEVRPYLNGGNQEEGQAEKDCRSGCFI